MHDSSILPDFLTLPFLSRCRNFFNKSYFLYPLACTWSRDLEPLSTSTASLRPGRKTWYVLEIAFLWTGSVPLLFLVVGDIGRRQNWYDPPRVDMVQFDGRPFHVENGTSFYFNLFFFNNFSLILLLSTSPKHKV